MALEAKKLPYRVIEITPGVGQVSIFRLSGQRQLPVLVDGDTVLTDSSVIVRYLDNKYPNPRLLPDDPKEVAQVHLLENWADTTLASAGRKALIHAAAINPELRAALLPTELPRPFQKFMRDFPYEIVSSLSQFLNKEEGAKLLKSLVEVAHLVKANQWVIGNALTVADIAIAAQLSLIRFPKSSGAQLKGKGCQGLSDHPQLQSLFQWRDQLEKSLFQAKPTAI